LPSSEQASPDAVMIVNAAGEMGLSHRLLTNGALPGQGARRS
jgi:hypothetical protein